MSQEGVSDDSVSVGLRALAAFFLVRHLFSGFPSKRLKWDQEEPCVYASRLPTVLGAFSTFALGVHNSALTAALAEGSSVDALCSFLSGSPFCTSGRF